MNQARSDLPPKQRDARTLRLASVVLALVIGGVFVGRPAARLWHHLSEGSAASAVAQRVVDSAISYGCRYGHYPPTVEALSLDLGGTDGGSVATLRWIAFRSTGDSFAVQNLLVGGAESRYPIDPSLCGTKRGSTATDAANKPVHLTAASGRR